MNRSSQAGLIGLAATFVVGAAGAQDQETVETVGGLQEITVTAQKREESLQDVPIAVTALSADDLEKAHITSLAGIGNRIPNFQFGRQSSSAGLAAYSIRGINANDTQSQLDAGVGVYLDGVYIGRNATAVFDLADIERIEVLRGPQGTLFGRNTTGGAISFITRAPTGEFGIRQDLTAGRYDEFRSRTRIDLPAMGPFTASLTYLHREIDGWVDNLSAGLVRDYTDYSDGRIGKVKAADTLGAEDVDAVFAAIRYDGGGSLIGTYRFDYTDYRGTQASQQTLGLRTEDNPFINPLGATIAYIYSLQPGLGGTNTISTRPLDAVHEPNRGWDRLEVTGHSLTLEYALNGGLTIKNIAAYRSAKTINVGNAFEGNLLIDPFEGTGNTFTILNALSTRSQHQISNELQLLGDSEALTWVAGAFYFQEEARDWNPVPFFLTYPATNAGFTLRPGDMFADVALKNSSFAVFAQATWHATDQLDLTFGARQTWDDREELNFRPDLQTPAGPPLTKVDFDKATWQFVAEYDLRNDLMVYGKVGTGYLSGGVYNTDPFEPEEITSYEIGFKGEFFDNRLRVNAAAFEADYKNLQIFYFTDKVFYENAGRAKTRGLEVEATAALGRGLTLFGNFGLLDFDFKEYISAQTSIPPVDIADIAHRAYAADWTFSAGFTYETRPFRSGAYLEFSADAQSTDDYQTIVVPISDPDLAKAATIESHWMVNARVSLVDLPISDVRATVSLWGKNLLDEREPLYVADISGLISGSFMRPRTYGVDLRMEF